MTSVCYHSKKPLFYDEIKVQLPLTIKKSHNILFTFYHISCKITKEKKKPAKDQIQTLLGYSFLPLFQDDHIVDNKDYNLPITTNIVTGYLSNKPELKVIFPTGG
jgi:hypothetical protein